MIIDQKILDTLTAQAKASERLRRNIDLRNSSEGQSQRMLNASEPGSPLNRWVLKTPGRLDLSAG